MSLIFCIKFQICFFNLCVFLSMKAFGKRTRSDIGNTHGQNVNQRATQNYVIPESVEIVTKKSLAHWFFSRIMSEKKNLTEIKSKKKIKFKPTTKKIVVRKMVGLDSLRWGLSPPEFETTPTTEKVMTTIKFRLEKPVKREKIRFGTRRRLALRDRRKDRYFREMGPKGWVTKLFNRSIPRLFDEIKDRTPFRLRYTTRSKMKLVINPRYKLAMDRLNRTVRRKEYRRRQIERFRNTTVTVRPRVFGRYYYRNTSGNITKEQHMRFLSGKRLLHRDQFLRISTTREPIFGKRKNIWRWNEHTPLRVYFRNFSTPSPQNVLDGNFTELEKDLMNHSAIAKPQIKKFVWGSYRGAREHKSGFKDIYGIGALPNIYPSERERYKPRYQPVPKMYEIKRTTSISLSSKSTDRRVFHFLQSSLNDFELTTSTTLTEKISETQSTTNLPQKFSNQSDSLKSDKFLIEDPLDPKYRIYQDEHDKEFSKPSESSIEKNIPQNQTISHRESKFRRRFTDNRNFLSEELNQNADDIFNLKPITNQNQHRTKFYKPHQNNSDVRSKDESPPNPKVIRNVDYYRKKNNEHFSARLIDYRDSDEQQKKERFDSNNLTDHIIRIHSHHRKKVFRKQFLPQARRISGENKTMAVFTSLERPFQAELKSKYKPKSKEFQNSDSDSDTQTRKKRYVSNSNEIYQDCGKLKNEKNNPRHKDKKPTSRHSFNKEHKPDHNQNKIKSSAHFESRSKEKKTPHQDRIKSETPIPVNSDAHTKTDKLFFHDAFKLKNRSHRRRNRTIRFVKKTFSNDSSTFFEDYFDPNDPICDRHGFMVHADNISMVTIPPEYLDYRPKGASPMFQKMKNFKEWKYIKRLIPKKNVTLYQTTYELNEKGELFIKEDGVAIIKERMAKGIRSNGTYYEPQVHPLIEKLVMLNARNASIREKMAALQDPDATPPPGGYPTFIIRTRFHKTTEPVDIIFQNDYPSEGDPYLEHNVYKFENGHAVEIKRPGYTTYMTKWTLLQSMTTSQYDNETESATDYYYFEDVYEKGSNQKTTSTAKVFSRITPNPK